MARFYFCFEAGYDFRGFEVFGKGIFLRSPIDKFDGGSLDASSLLFIDQLS
ncbi:MAG: hypothetical protein GY896_11415 [Gammaproteobacteria bacterium]|nr:hypothetical protein [Gammaproteobacteria bacterium]